MSYARFGWEGSDVYVLRSGSMWHIYMTGLPTETTRMPGDCADRLELLRTLNLCVPQSAIDRLRREQENWTSGAS